LVPRNELINYLKPPPAPVSGKKEKGNCELIEAKMIGKEKKREGEDIVKYLITFDTHEREINKQWEGKEIDKYFKAK